jgi:hypothetical protein
LKTAGGTGGGPQRTCRGAGGVIGADSGGWSSGSSGAVPSRPRAFRRPAVDGRRHKRRTGFCPTRALRRWISSTGIAAPRCTVLRASRWG